MKSDLEERNETNGSNLDRKGIYRSDDFRNLFNLVAQEDKIDNEDWFLRTFIACFLLKLLTKTSFFDTQESDILAENCQLTEDELYVGTILLEMINVCPSNVHDISEIESPATDQFLPSCNKVSLGAGMFPSLALFNHSCKPDFMRCNPGNGVVCVANRDIKKGDYTIYLIA